MATSIQILPLAPGSMKDGCPACLSLRHGTFTDRPEDNEYFTARKSASRILECGECSALYQSPFPDTAETNSFYGPDYQNYAASKVPFLSDLLHKQTRAVAERFAARFGKNACVLDFGCGSGLFLQGLLHTGLEKLYGYDVALRLDESFSRKIGIFNDLSALEKSGVRFDVIRMNHVIEHLSDLDGTMALLARLLKTDGVIVGQTPNAAHYTRRLFGRFWGPLHYPYHTVLFTKQSLQAAAPRWGLRLDNISPCLMPTGWAMSLENMFKKVTKSQRRGRSPLYTLFIMDGLPFALLDLLRGDTAIFDFELRPSASTHKQD